MSEGIWLTASTLLGVGAGWFLTFLSNRALHKSVKKSTYVAILSEIFLIRNELTDLKNRIEAAKTKGNPDYRFYSPPLFHRKFVFQNWDFSRYSSNLWLLDRNTLNVLVVISGMLHYFNMAHEFLSGGGVYQGMSVSEILELDDSKPENKDKKFFFNAMYQTIDALILRCEEITTLLHKN